VVASARRAIDRGERTLRRPALAAHQLFESGVGRPITRQKPEIARVQQKRAILTQVNQMVQDQIDEAGLAIRRESHQLVFAGIYLQAAMVRERAIEQSERMRVVDLGDRSHFGAGPVGDRGGRPLAHSIHNHDRGVAEWRRIESGCHV
jgi:hypothetical protein